MLVHRRQRGLGPGDLVLGEEVVNSLGINRGLLDRFLHLDVVRADLAVCPAFGEARLGLVGVGRGAGKGAGVALEQLDRLGPARGHGLVGEQSADAAEHFARNVVPVELELAVELDALDPLVERIEEDLQVLLDVNLVLACERGGELDLQILVGGELRQVAALGNVEGLAVVLLISRGGRALGHELGVHHRELHGVGIAAGDPGRLGGDGGCGSRLVLRNGGRNGERRAA